MSYVSQLETRIEELENKVQELSSEQKKLYKHDDVVLTTELCAHGIINLGRINCLKFSVSIGGVDIFSTYEFIEEDISDLQKNVSILYNRVEIALETLGCDMERFIPGPGLLCMLIYNSYNDEKTKSLSFNIPAKSKITRWVLFKRFLKGR